MSVPSPAKGWSSFGVTLDAKRDSAVGPVNDEDGGEVEEEAEGWEKVVFWKTDWLGSTVALREPRSPKKEVKDMVGVG